MTNMIKSASDEVREIILKALGALVSDGTFKPEPIPDFIVEIPNDKSHGDLSTNVSMVCAKVFRLPPRKIADLICEKAILDGTYFDKIEVAGAGFINFFLGMRWYAQTVNSVLSENEHYGETDYGKGKRVLVEFVSANPTGPMHIGNARGGAIGDCLASVLQKAGYYVEREFYVNDAGNQINKFAKSLEIRYLQLFKDGIEIPEDCYLGEDIVNHAKAFAEINGDKYVDLSEEERRTALVEFALPKNIQGLKDDLAKYKIFYDTWFLESTLHNNGEVLNIIERLKQSSFTYEQDGALWFKSSELGDDKDRVLVRDNGVPTYVVPDIAYHYNKLVTRKFDIAIDILGADHHGYIPRIKASMQALGVDPDRLKIVIMQMVNLVKDGEKYKLSKRSGKAITLNTLLDEIPIDAARFFFNLREPNSQFDFDMSLAIEKTSQNPVFYVQYAHARICSIIRNLESEGVKVESENLDLSKLLLLSTPEEKELIRFIATMPNVINDSAKALDPSKITKYSVDLATLFHKFYSQCHVKGEEESIMQARLKLCIAVKTVLKNLLDMLNITCPDKM